MTRLFFEPFRLATLTSLAVLAACAPGTDAAQTRSRPQAGAFASDRITVEVRGAGPDVILIPGLTSSRRIWARAVEATPGYRYHLVQLNGFGGAPVRGNAQGPVAAPAAEEIARYIAETGLEKPAVVGHSMGGAIALMLAARHPDAVGRAMVLDMLPFMGALFGPPGATPESVRETADKLRDQIQGANGVAWALATQQNMGSMVKSEAMRSLAVDDAHRSDRGMAARALHELITTDLRPELRHITAPVTVLYVRSPATPLNVAQTDAVFRAGYAGLPHAVLKRVPDSYHFIMFDQPERFAAELKAFLAG
jgi:pimeloyl-ACP methyl ester carboxylesterase